MLDTDTRELTVKVEKALMPAPVPGTALLILDTVKVERARVVLLILFPIRVEYNKVDVVMVEVTVIELPVSAE